jgi:molybdopterin-guanine dinucleotide biosynthesis protein A
MEFTNIMACGAILIGGKSRRFKTDKTYIQFSGESLSVLLYKRISRVLNHVYFVADRGEKSPVPDVDVIVDLKPDIGPIGGLYTALTHSSHDYCFVSACDLPFLNVDLIKLLWDKCTGTNDIVVPVWDSGIEPLAAFYHTRCIPFIKSALEKDQFMMKGFWDQVRTDYIDVASYFNPGELRKIFFNINTAGDYETARLMLEEMTN